MGVGLEGVGKVIYMVKIQCTKFSTIQKNERKPTDKGLHVQLQSDPYKLSNCN